MYKQTDRQTHIHPVTLSKGFISTVCYVFSIPREELMLKQGITEQGQCKKLTKIGYAKLHKVIYNTK